MYIHIYIYICTSVCAGSIKSKQKRHEERFCHLVADAAAKGGKVFIPVNAFHNRSHYTYIYIYDCLCVFSRRYALSKNDTKRDFVI